MSRLFEALSKLERERNLPKVVSQVTAAPATIAPDMADTAAAPQEAAKWLESESGSTRPLHLKVVPPNAVAPVASVVGLAPMPVDNAPMPIDDSPTLVASREALSLELKASPESRLVALKDPNSLGAEKFRALVARLDDMRKQRDLKSFQVTSSTINEGKSLVAGNVAITLANYSGRKTLLVEGDLRRPTLAKQLGLNELPGLSHWWADRNQDLAAFIYKFNDMPLWFLPAGKFCDRSSEIIGSEQFAKAFAKLTSHFDWIVVDSTPMLPIVDVNLWSKIVDGTLLVVRQRITPIESLKKGLQALDHPKLLGVILNDAAGSDHENYGNRYYGSGSPTRDSAIA